MIYEDKHIDELISMRIVARQNKDWQLADELRNYMDNKLVFIFDVKDGQDVYWLNHAYFLSKDKFLETLAMNNRQYVEYRIKRDIRAENNFDAWLYSMNNSKKSGE